MIRSPATRPSSESPATCPGAASGRTVTTVLGSSRSRDRSAVMIFVRLAIGRGWSGLLENSTCPVDRSPRIAPFAATSGGWSLGAGVWRTVGNGEGEP